MACILGLLPVAAAANDRNLILALDASGSIAGERLTDASAFRSDILRDVSAELDSLTVMRFADCVQVYSHESASSTRAFLAGQTHLASPTATNCESGGLDGSLTNFSVLFRELNEQLLGLADKGRTYIWIVSDAKNDPDGECRKRGTCNTMPDPGLIFQNLNMEAIQSLEIVLLYVDSERDGSPSVRATRRDTIKNLWDERMEPQGVSFTFEPNLERSHVVSDLVERMLGHSPRRGARLDVTETDCGWRVDDVGAVIETYHRVQSWYDMPIIVMMSGNVNESVQLERHPKPTRGNKPIERINRQPVVASNGKQLDDLAFRWSTSPALTIGWMNYVITVKVPDAGPLHWNERIFGSISCVRRQTPDAQLHIMDPSVLRWRDSSSFFAIPLRLDTTNASSQGPMLRLFDSPVTESCEQYWPHLVGFVPFTPKNLPSQDIPLVNGGYELVIAEPEIFSDDVGLCAVQPLNARIGTAVESHSARIVYNGHDIDGHVVLLALSKYQRRMLIAIALCPILLALAIWFQSFNAPRTSQQSASQPHDTGNTIKAELGGVGQQVVDKIDRSATNITPKLTARSTIVFALWVFVLFLDIQLLLTVMRLRLVDLLITGLLVYAIALAIVHGTAVVLCVTRLHRSGADDLIYGTLSAFLVLCGGFHLWVALTSSNALQSYVVLIGLALVWWILRKCGRAPLGALKVFFSTGH